MEFDYRKLTGKIKEVYSTQEVFSKSIGMSRSTLSQKLNNRVQFTGAEILTSCRALGIKEDQVSEYFFTPLVQQVEQKPA